MIVAYYVHAIISASGAEKGPLVVDTWRGKVLPPRFARWASRHIPAEDLTLYPGFINAHDHLTLNHYPRTRWRARYLNAREWAAEMSAQLDAGHFADLRAWPLRDACWVGGLKNLFSGVTTVVQHNPLHRPLRRRDFPVYVWRRYRWAHSLYLSDAASIQHGSRGRAPFFIHLAEGTDTAAGEEYATLETLGAARPNTLLVHGVGLRGDALARVVETCGGLVWCPSSNAFLLGQTANVRPWAAADKLLLGSDSRLTADGDLWDELRAAYATEQINARALFRAITMTPARILGAPGRGCLAPGCRADAVALRLPPGLDPFAGLLTAERGALAWVMRGGRLAWDATAAQPNAAYAGRPVRLDARLWRAARRLHLPDLDI